ncbi:MAG TPA: M28 family peptidase [Myxococcales bacterium]|nr:M28 family peptidase [Myxococcales bacterium]
MLLTEHCIRLTSGYDFGIVGESDSQGREKLRSHIGLIVFVAVLLVAGPGNAETESENKQALATTPEALVEMLAEKSFLKPKDYAEKLRSERSAHFYPMGRVQISQNLDPATDPRRDITAGKIAADAEVLAEIGRESKRDGELLWGRIQGTKYERKALRWIFEELQSRGLEDVHYDSFPSGFPQWRPTVNRLSVVSAPGFGPQERFDFRDAITAFVSASTPKGGLRAPVIYVGDGTDAELQGRKLDGQIVLLRGRTLAGALISSARTAYSRLAAGKYGMPAAVVVWWDVPGTRQVAGRVGAPGGGDSIGEALPWTTIGNEDGLYLRKLLDRATEEKPVVAEIEIQGRMESGKDRMSGNVYAMLPGRSGDYIVIPTHVDGYFYGIHDNGSSVALNLSLAEHYAKIPPRQREHGIIFLFQGDHEVPGVGGTLPFIDKHRKLMKDHLLVVLRPEHLGMLRRLDEALYVSQSNVAEPLMLMVTNRSPALIDLFKRASESYGIPMGDLVYADPAADEAAFHPPYNDLDAISMGWISIGKFYHSTADVDLGGVDFSQMERLARAHAFIIDELFKLQKEDLRRGGHPVPSKTIYQSDLIQIIMGDN